MADDMMPVSGEDRSDADFERLEDELGRLARELADTDVTLETPPPELWSAIEAEVRADSGGSGDSVLQNATAAGVGEPRPSRIGAPRGLGSLPHSPVPSRPAPGRIRTGLRGVPAALAAAAVLAMVLATGAALIVRSTDASDVVAQADISNDELPVPLDGSGTALLRQQGDDLFLELELPDLGAAGAEEIYEVWMIDSGIEGMISLGGLGAADDDTVRIDLPDNIDHTRFPIVDISVEPLDGDPTHSGQSVLRGVLTDVDNT